MVHQACQRTHGLHLPHASIMVHLTKPAAAPAKVNQSVHRSTGANATGGNHRHCCGLTCRRLLKIYSTAQARILTSSLLNLLSQRWSSACVRLFDGKSESESKVKCPRIWMVITHKAAPSAAKRRFVVFGDSFSNRASFFPSGGHGKRIHACC